MACHSSFLGTAQDLRVAAKVADDTWALSIICLNSARNPRRADLCETHLAIARSASSAAGSRCQGLRQACKVLVHAHLGGCEPAQARPQLLRQLAGHTRDDARIDELLPVLQGAPPCLQTDET